jgi:hypothetical protein
MIGREKVVLGVVDRWLEGRKLAKEISKSRGEVIEKGLDQRSLSTKVELGKTKSKLGQINKAIESIEGDETFQKKSKVEVL